MTKAKTNSDEFGKLLVQIKSWAIQAMFSEDELLEQLVLKGGNAMALIHQVSARASVDLDFSLKQDFGDAIAEVQSQIASALSEKFEAEGYHVIDFSMYETPKAISDDMKHFWGGYKVEFKLVTAEVFKANSTDIEVLRRLSINLGQGPKFLIDISRFEYVEHKQEFDFDGYLIYVYSPEMIVCEKLRAICQQMPEYGPVVKRTRGSTPRPRDFLDIFVLVDTLQLDMTSDRAAEILAAMFELKKVPLAFLGKVGQTHDFHATAYSSVEATVAPGFKLKEFDFYFAYVLQLIEKLKPFWDK